MKKSDKKGKSPKKSERKPSIYDQAFVDPDKVRRQKEQEELIGPIKPIEFSKSIDDEPNPKYGIQPLEKKEFTPKERQKYKERFPYLAEVNKTPGAKKAKAQGPKSKSKAQGPKKDKHAELEERFNSAAFKKRFTPFEDEHKVYSHKPSNPKKRFEGRDKDLEQQLKADYNPNEKMPLNKYVARCGVCSRRDAVDIIKAGRIQVNGETILEPGFKVNPGDTVKLDGKTIQTQENYVYILMNKPKGYITTLDDPKGRKIVSDLYKDEIKERIFPVGRLDRNTTGLLLLTNDGDLANKLAHPKYKVRKIYQVKLNKAVSLEHMQQIIDGLQLEDGIAEVDNLSYLSSKDEIGIEIHSGKNRIVRRIFEHLGYEVEKLDRVYYAGLTKKNLPRGTWRHLTRQEVINLKHLNRFA